MIDAGFTERQRAARVRYEKRSKSRSYGRFLRDVWEAREGFEH